MTRVDESREAQRVAEQRRLEDAEKGRRAEANEEFRRVVSQQQRARAAAALQAQATARGEAKARSAAHGSAAAALLARQGIQSHDLASALQQYGERSVEKARVEVTGRREDSLELRRQLDEPLGGGEDVAHDALVALGGDERREHGGLGGEAQDGGTMEMSGQQPGRLTQGASAPAGESTGAERSRLPPEVLQRLVAHVFAGVTPEGLSRFTIVLADGVLGGARLDVTGKEGKITCTFHSGEANVRRLLESSAGALARALAHKGLRLERLEVVDG